MRGSRPSFLPPPEDVRACPGVTRGDATGAGSCGAAGAASRVVPRPERGDAVVGRPHLGSFAQVIPRPLKEVGMAYLLLLLIGIPMVLAAWIWVIVDLFLLPSMVREENARIFFRR